MKNVNFGGANVKAIMAEEKTITNYKNIPEKDWDIFISWHDDKGKSPKYGEQVKMFLDAIFDKKKNIFFSADIPSGQWREHVKEALEQSKFLIILLTNEALESGWVHAEYGAFYMKVLKNDISHEDIYALKLPGAATSSTKSPIKDNEIQPVDNELAFKTFCKCVDKSCGLHIDEFYKIFKDNIAQYNSYPQNPTIKPYILESVKCAENCSELPCAILNNFKDCTFIPRDSDVKMVADKLQSKKIVNITGIGGCGKSTISILYLVGNHDKESIYQKGFKDCYSHITDIIINTDDVYKEFCVRFVDETMILEYKMRQDDKQPDYKETFKSILVQLSQYPTDGDKPNLFLMDVNETADYQKVREVITEFCTICNKNWKLLVVSREQLCKNSVDYIDISRVDTIEFSFIRRLFIERLDIKIKQWYEKFSDDDFSKIFLKLGNLPILVKALAEFLNGEDVKKASDLLFFLGDGDLGKDLNDVQLSSVNKEGIKEEVYNKISAFLRLLCIFKNLPSDIHKHIVRYMMLWDADYYSKSFIQQVVLGKSIIDVKFNNALLDLEHKCWLDSRRNGKNVLEYKMHSLIAQSCREQVFENDDNPEYKDYSSYLDNIDRISKLANNELSALSQSLIIYDLTDNDDCLLRQAHRFMHPSIYEKALRIKVLKLYCSYNVDFRDAMDKIKNIPIDRLYYSWLDRYSGYSTDIRHYKSVGNEVIDNYVMNMVLLNGGTYPMGSIYATNERPVHSVTLSDFYIGKSQVSQGLWKAVVGNNPSDKDKGIGDEYPVNCVSWYDCLYFIIELNKLTRLKFRLPTEAEWEYAARSGGKNYTYSWTADAEEKLKVLPNNVDVLLQDYAWNQVNSKRVVHENSKLKPNDLGIYDMSGNLWEWCQDWYDENFYQKSNGVENPCCEIPAIEKEFPIPTRVLRGGSWDGTAWNCRVFSRGRYSSCSCVYEFGFRLAMSFVKMQNE